MAFTLNVQVTRAKSSEIFAEKLSKGRALPYIDSANLQTERFYVQRRSTVDALTG